MGNLLRFGLRPQLDIIYEPRVRIPIHMAHIAVCALINQGRNRILQSQKRTLTYYISIFSLWMFHTTVTSTLSYYNFILSLNTVFFDYYLFFHIPTLGYSTKDTH